MRKTLPDEHGWYWAKSPRDGEWCMAFVNMNRETITLFDGVDPRNDQIEYPMDEFKNSDRHWYGPFNCPGTDFGQHTIVMEEELHRKAEAECRAMCVTYVDYKYCDDENHHSSIAITELRTRADADEWSWCQRRLLCYRSQESNKVSGGRGQ
jgi:hypothetical protein